MRQLCIFTDERRIALGGAIGSGLIIGSGEGLATYGPLSLLLGYSVTGLLCFIVITALGEMATWLPLGTGFPGYASRFVDPALGFALGWSSVLHQPIDWVVCALTVSR